MPYKTYGFRIKDSAHINWLKQKAGAVNFVWNYCNQMSYRSIKDRFTWLSGFDLCGMTKGSSKKLYLKAQTIAAVCIEYVKVRDQFHKRILRWRSAKKNLGWIPLNPQSIEYNIGDDHFSFMNRKFRFWKDRDIPSRIKSGCFSEDSQGRWYIHFICEVPVSEIKSNKKDIGIDLGLKTLLTLSDGNIFARENLTKKYKDFLAKAQRANKKKRVKKIHAKIANSRKDFAHKATTEIVNSYKNIYVGDVSSKKLLKTKMAKSVSDAAWYQLKTLLNYKAIIAGNVLVEVNEAFSSCACSNCFVRSGPSGLRQLGVREWTCSNCGVKHDRDVNAAKNILRLGL